MTLLLHGMMPNNLIFKVNEGWVEFGEVTYHYLQHLAVTHKDVIGRRSSLAEEWARRIHVVAFFVPQGEISNSAAMDRLADFYTKITVEHSNISFMSP